MSDVFCDSSMMTNDSRRSWDCLAELLKTEVLLFMRFLIHQTWYLLIVISPILFVVRLTLITIQASQIHAFILLVKHPILRIELEETSCWSFNWPNSELIAIGTTNGTPFLRVIGMRLLIVLN